MKYLLTFESLENPHSEWNEISDEDYRKFESKYRDNSITSDEYDTISQTVPKSKQKFYSKYGSSGNTSFYEMSYQFTPDCSLISLNRNLGGNRLISAFGIVVTKKEDDWWLVKFVARDHLLHDMFTRSYVSDELSGLVSLLKHIQEDEVKIGHQNESLTNIRSKSYKVFESEGDSGFQEVKYKQVVDLYKEGAFLTFNQEEIDGILPYFPEKSFEILNSLSKVYLRSRNYKKTFEILKHNDDYYTLTIFDVSGRKFYYYLCDEYDGLLRCLETMMPFHLK